MSGPRPSKYLTFGHPVLAATQFIIGSVPQRRATPVFVHAYIGGEGMTRIDISKVPRGNPLEVVERMATSQQWSFERVCEDEITIVVRGKCADYQVSFTWMHELEALHLACAFELKLPERSKIEIQHLVPMINMQMWVGHFDLWLTDELVMFRHTHLLSGGIEASHRQCEVLLWAALQFVAWSGEGAREALEAVMFETAGEA
jgi:hypothetical protein